MIKVRFCFLVALIGVLVLPLMADVSVSPFAENDQPVISGEGTATISRKAVDGTYAVIASGVTLPWTDTTTGLFPGKDYVYKVEVDGSAAVELSYSHIVRLERSWADTTKVRPSVRMIGSPAGTGKQDIGIIFNGVTTDYYEYPASSTIGVDFGRPIKAKYIRIAPRSGQVARLNGKVVYGAIKEDFSDAVAIGTCAVANGWAEFELDNASSLRFLYVTPVYGNATEIEIYGYDFGAVVRGFLTNNIPVVDATINGTADIYRDGALIANGVALPWADTGILSQGKTYTYRVVSTVDSALDFTTTYQHTIRLGHSWNDLTTLSSDCVLISDSTDATYNANVFDGNPATHKEPGNFIGVDFIQPRIMTMVRVCPRSGQASRCEGTVFYGANEADYSDEVALTTFTVTSTAFSYRDFYIAEPNAYRYYYTRKSSDNNVAELEFYGYNETVKSIDVTITRGEYDYRTLNSAILFNVNIYRDGELIAENVSLPWTDEATLAASNTYKYKVAKVDDEEVFGEFEYYHIIRLERSWKDLTRLRPYIYSLSSRFFNNSILSNPDYMYDGNTSTMHPLTSHDGLDFGRKVRVELFRAYRNSIPSRYNGSMFYGANSPDFSDEVLLATTSSNYTTVGWYETTPTNTAAYRYYRFEWSPNGGYNMSYFPPAEFELYGSPVDNVLYFGMSGTNDAPVVDAWYNKAVDIYRDDELVAESVLLPWIDLSLTLKAGTTYHYKAVPKAEEFAAFEGDYLHLVRLERSYDALSQPRSDIELGTSAGLLFDRYALSGFERTKPIFSFPEPVTIHRVGYASIHGNLPERMANMRLFGANSEEDLATNATEVLHFKHKVSDGQGILDVPAPQPFKYYQIYNTEVSISAIAELDFYGVGAPWFDIKAANDLDKPYLYGQSDLGLVDVYRDGKMVASQVTIPWVDSEANLIAGSKHLYSLRLSDGTMLSREYTHWELIGRTWADLGAFNRCTMISLEPTAINLFDGDHSTYGNFTNSQAVVTLDFGSPIFAAAVRVLPVCIHPINSYVVVTGANEADFSDAVTLATAPFPVNDETWSTYEIPEAKRAKYRYYRFFRQAWYGQVREIQLFGKNRNQLIFMVR